MVDYEWTDDEAIPRPEETSPPGADEWTCPACGRYYTLQCRSARYRCGTCDRVRLVERQRIVGLLRAQHAEAKDAFEAEQGDTGPRAMTWFGALGALGRALERIERGE